MFSVCVPATRASTVGHTVRSILGQTAADWELVVVCQGDADVVQAATMAASGGDQRVRWIHIDERGSSKARNAALRAATGDLVALIDDDCEAAPDWLATIGRCLDQQPDVMVVGGALLAPAPARRGPGNCPSLVPSDSVYDPISDHRQAPTGWDWVTANVGFRRPILERIGLLDEHLGPGTNFQSCEDTDFKLRFERAGVRMRTTPGAIVHHTFGWRYGARAVLRHQRNYARGNGAMAAKLTLMGDRRGMEWWREMRDDCLARWYRRRAIVQLPAGLRRWRHFSRAYRECVTTFRVDERGLLTPSAASPARVPAYGVTRT